MAQINTMLRNPLHGVYETLGESIMRGELDEPTFDPDIQLPPEDIQYGIDEDTNEDTVLLSKMTFTKWTKEKA